MYRVVLTVTSLSVVPIALPSIPYLSLLLGPRFYKLLLLKRRKSLL